MKVGEFPADVVTLIWIRDQGSCAMCGRALLATRRGLPDYEGGWSVQHREARGKGGAPRKHGRDVRPWLTRASNGVLMCGDGVTGCHGDVETRNRAGGFALGFVVSAIGVRRPASVPIKHALHGWVTLTDAGGFEPAEAPEEEAIAA